MDKPFGVGAGSNLRIEERGSALAACLAGTVDVSAAEELHRGFLDLAESGKDVVVDLSAAERLDTSALQLLLALRRELAGSGRSLSLDGCPPPIRAYLELAGVWSDLADTATGAPRAS